MLLLKLFKGSFGDDFGLILDLLDTFDFGDVEHEHVLDAGLEGEGRGGAAATGSLEFEPDNAVMGEAFKFQVAPIALDNRSDSAGQNLLDRSDNI